ncbi:MAG: hypothetical protein MZW92_41925 [Comamonadaceae bacterium]|nr:hypothetical protein [Comamonadaceae bacterium]
MRAASQLIVKKWERKKRLPDAIVIEHPRLAGGHLGAAQDRRPERPALRLRERDPARRCDVPAQRRASRTRCR